jgi:hypothetical protein
MGFNMDDYVDVAERLKKFKEVYPNGSLQQVSLQFIDFAGKSWVVYTAAAYRSPDDITPGHGTAWEPVPGTSSFKRDSEVMNAETSAWGRAIIAVLVADGGKRIASRNEIEARQDPAAPGEVIAPRGRVQAGSAAGNPSAPSGNFASAKQINFIKALAKGREYDEGELLEKIHEILGKNDVILETLTAADATKVIGVMK